MPLLRINRNPSAPQLLVFAAAGCAVLGGVAVRQWIGGRPIIAGACVLLGLNLLVAWWLAPEVLRRAFVALSIVTYPVGFVISHVVLFVLYFVVLTPIGLAMRAFGRDPLERGFNRAAATYWRQRTEHREARDYLRQS